jgi:O-antigen/teichoic acid export membrane protein
VNGTLSGALVGFQAFQRTARISFAVGVITLPAMVGGALSAGLRGAVVGTLFIQICHLILLYSSVRNLAAEHGLQLSWFDCWNDRAALLSFSIPAWINSALTAPVNWLSAAVLVNLGGGYSEMGFFQVANSWFLILLFVPSRLSQVYLPLLEGMLAQGKEDEAARLVWKQVKLLVPVGFGMAICLSLGSDFVLRWYGEEYLQARGAVLATIWAAAFIAVHHPLGVFLIAKSRMWDVLKYSIARAGINVAAAFALCRLGATGMATARLLAYAGYVMLISFLAVQLLSSSLSRRNMHSGADVRRPSAAA